MRGIREDPSLIVIGLVLLLTIAGVYAWVTWPDRTMDRFMAHVRSGDMEAAHAMLAEPIDDRYMIDDVGLEAAARVGVTPRPRTLSDMLFGRRRFDVQLAYANDHSLSVRHGKVSLGGSYFILLVPRPSFELRDDHDPGE